MRILYLFLISLSVKGITFAKDIYPYKVKKGETISSIIYNHFPQLKIYGKNGLLFKTLKMNPQLKNPNEIFKDQIIFLPFEVVTPKSTINTKAKPKDKVMSKILFEEGLYLSLIYGAHFQSMSQTGVLGRGNLGTLFFNHFSFLSEIILKDYTLETHLQSYDFKFESQSNNDSSKIYGLSLIGSYKNISAGFDFNQQPIFKNDNGNLYLNTLSIASASLGVKGNLELKSRKKTILQFSSNILYPVTISSGEPDISFENISGYGINLNLNYKKQLFFTPNYELYLNWINQVSHRNYQFDADWDTSVGEVKANYTDMIFLLGLSLSF
jgi:hypothetical protein